MVKLSRPITIKQQQISSAKLFTRRQQNKNNGFRAVSGTISPYCELPSLTTMYDR